MPRMILIIALLLSSCATKEEVIPEEPPQLRLAVYDYNQIYDVTKTAFHEARSEGHQNIRVLVYSIFNRARRHNLSLEETTKCSKKRCWYTYHKEVSAKEQRKREQSEVKVFEEIYNIVKDMYIGHALGKEYDFPVSKYSDHFITIKLAKSGEGPWWYYNKCKEKTQIGRHMHCVGIYN